MTDDETAFVHAARLALYRAPPGPPGSVRALLAEEDDNPLATDEDLARMRATSLALEAAGPAGFAEALRAAFPPPDGFAPGDPAPVVDHPVHGVGLVEPWSTGSEVRIRFPDGLRTFRGTDARFPAPARAFARAAADLVGPLAPSLPEDEAWAAIEAVRWADGGPIDHLAAALAARTPYLAVHGLLGRIFSLGAALRDRIEAFEAESGEALPCGDDGLGDLAHHVVGCGRAEYAATLADPRRALARAEARDYRESFAYVPLQALEAFPPAAVLGAIAAVAPVARVEHPVHGAGFRFAGARWFPSRVLLD